MKKFLFLFLPLALSAQNAEERANILSKSKPQDILLLKNEIRLDSLRNAKEVADYVQKYGLYNGLKPERVEGGVPYFYAVDDNELSVISLNARNLQPGGSLPIPVNGSGINVALWDGGRVRTTHVEFGNRVVLGDGATTLNTHATHVLGTIIASGVSPSPTRRGFATASTATAYDFSNDLSEVETYAGFGNLVSNHSYGNIAAQLTTAAFGQYTSQSRLADIIHATFPFYQMVKSAGNDRDSQNLAQVSAKGGYDLLSGMSCSKNILTIGAVRGFETLTENNNGVLTDFTNFGPTDDGRIKPDLVAKGFQVNSPISVSDNAYSDLSGTSMSAPAVTGLIVLLQKHYNNLNSGDFMKSATVRGLLCHTAQDLGESVGPDYSYGYGIPDGMAAASVISNRNQSTIVDELSLSQGQTYTRTIQLNSPTNLTFTLSWTDPAGVVNVSSDVDNRSSRLINNLDIKILKDQQVFYPWKLDPESVLDPATNSSDNDVDNLEKVEIFNATPGVYTIQVTHKGALLGGAQEFSLIGSSSTGLSLSNSAFTNDNTFFVYPNPAQNEIHFNNPKGLNLDEVSIYDITGKLVLSSQGVVNNTMDVSRLQSGVYMVKIASQGATFVRKFTKN
ncbi:MAG: S8 family peptidase [Flavobacterium sp.]|jgi:serine protease AprX|uniref:S8 family peptidase n=1 Tax=Flavobacterium sp. TaxID=239 RepID=UPI0022CA46A7|nr:S8 family peptidase [Flavobacterium sp.]MCZ8169409.1 S8 family peptidase [Flavobacterium sp.]MCZ8295832.1 S8 family peptidase [Flavobacterium sp.]